MDESRIDEEARAHVPEDILNGGVLTIGTYAPSPPTRMFTEDGMELTGLDITISEEVAASLGLRPRFQIMKWDGLLPALRSGRFEMVAAQMGDYPDRHVNGDFVDYFTHGASAVALESNVGSFPEGTELCGKRVGHQTGVAAGQELPLLSDECEEQGLDRLELHPFPDDAAGLLAVRSGQTDAHAMDTMAALYQVERSQEATPLQIVADDLVQRGNIGLVISPDRPELTEAVRVAMENMHESGRYAEILEEHGVSDYGVKEITVNTSNRVSSQ